MDKKGSQDLSMLNYDKAYEPFMDALSGASGGVVAQILFYPLENLRTRLQTVAKEEEAKFRKLCIEQEHLDPESQECRKQIEKFSEIQYIKDILKAEGIQGFYKGLESAMIGTIASSGIYFGLYRFWKNFFYEYLGRKELSDLDVTLITAVSGVMNSVITNPIWFLNTRMATSSGKKSLFDTIKTIYKNEGVLAFYKGVLPNMILVLNPIINFVVYEAIKKYMTKNNMTLSAINLFLASSIGKIIATIFTFPILTVRSRLQVDKKEHKRNLIIQILKIIKQLGINGLYLGVFAKMLQTVLYNGFLMITYEKLRKLIKYMVLLYLQKMQKIKQ